MGIKRYYAKSDNTITNAFEENLSLRGTGSNMGAADILEVFSIYGQASSASAEKSRVLIKFDCTASTNSIQADRTSGDLPASGSVSFYLRLYNAKHGQTLPKSYTMDISAVNGSWAEGTGLDMELYKDKGESSWINANGSDAKATYIFTANSRTSGQANTRQLTVVDADGTSVTFTIDNSTDTSTATIIAFSNANSNRTQFGINTAAAINASALRITATAGGSMVTLESDVSGRSGNSIADPSGTAIDDGCIDNQGSSWSGGDGPWISEGGDYFTDTSSSFTASFDSGVEDIELDITTLVEQWLDSAGNVLGSKNDEGVAARLSSTYESASRSYYTKKFFARGTEFFFKKPCIEARWDSSIEDDRGNFYYSSSLATAEENLNTLYFYNYFRGRLRNIPDVGTGNIGVSIFSSSADSPTGSAITLVADGTHVRSGATFAVTGGYVSTGIYSASFAMTAAATPLTAINDVWFSLSDSITNAAAGTQYGTGTIAPQTVKNLFNAPANKYMISVTNLRDFYRSDETARFRIYTRQKDWAPTIYTKAINTPAVQVVESGSYEIYRVIDDLKVIPYGTGSTKHTFLSYDTSGSYFDLDMNMFETGYFYGIKLSFYNEDLGSYVEQPETFKFKVESRQNK